MVQIQAMNQLIKMLSSTGNSSKMRSLLVSNTQQ
jgi:hypothetical protein